MYAAPGREHKTPKSASRTWLSAVSSLGGRTGPEAREARHVRRRGGGRAWEGPPPRAVTGGPPASLIQQLPTDQFLNGLVSGAQPEAWARPVDPPGSLFGHSAPALPMKRAGRGIMPETRISGPLVH